MTFYVDIFEENEFELNQVQNTHNNLKNEIIPDTGLYYIPLLNLK